MPKDVKAVCSIFSKVRRLFMLYNQGLRLYKKPDKYNCQPCKFEKHLYLSGFSSSAVQEYKKNVLPAI
jgi:hypothetical protein